MKIAGMITVLLCGIVLLWHTGSFPEFGDEFSPASQYLSPHYIEKTIEETSVPNIVTAVLGDYRGFDTMFETTVVFAAGLACFFLLKRKTTPQPGARFYRHLPTGVTLHIEEGGKIPSDSSTVFKRIDSNWTPHALIIKNTSRLIIPFIQLFALYVIAHGHHSPGGGFQGGVLLGASIILFAISFDLRTAVQRFNEKKAAIMAALGVMIFAGTGVVCMMAGSEFLNYGGLSSLMTVDAVSARSHGILIVEIGVALTVQAVMVWIYYNLSSAGAHDEGL